MIDFANNQLVKFLEDSGFLIKDITQTFENKTK